MSELIKEIEKLEGTLRLRHQSDVATQINFIPVDDQRRPVVRFWIEVDVDWISRDDPRAAGTGGHVADSLQRPAVSHRRQFRWRC